jgi:hypothetical protein
LQIVVADGLHVVRDLQVIHTSACYSPDSCVVVPSVSRACCVAGCWLRCPRGDHVPTHDVPRAALPEVRFRH